MLFPSTFKQCRRLAQSRPTFAPSSSPAPRASCEILEGRVLLSAAFALSSDSDALFSDATSTVVAPMNAGSVAVVSLSAATPSGAATLGQGQTLDFGSGRVGGKSVVRTFTLTNHGSAVLQLSGLGRGLSVGGAFKLLSAPSRTTVGSGQSATFTVVMDTSTAGTKRGSLTLVTNAAGKGFQNSYNPLQITLTGSAHRPTPLPPAPAHRAVRRVFPTLALRSRKT